MRITPNGVVRELRGALPDTHFLHTQTAAALAGQGQLVAFHFATPTEIHSPLVPFVSLPCEWSDAQLRAAADLTLAVSRQALAGGFELKDASAWNIVFEGTVPLFCDHLSFQPIGSRQWWAFGQFVRHFVFPLGLSERAGLRAYRSFRLQRDGMAPDEVRKLLGLRRFMTRLWPLLSSLAGNGAPNAAPGAAPLAKGGRSLHANLYDFCQWSLGGLGQRNRRNRNWQAYTDTRSHYPDSASLQKQQQVRQWMLDRQPAWVLDLGCNTGEYTRMAADAGARVIAVDSDHDCVEQLFMREAGRRDIHPVVANLADLNGGGGWNGSEYTSLATRLAGQVDMVLMLALIHHLAVSESIPFDRIAALAAGMSRRYVVVEFIGADDPLLQHLAHQRRRDGAEFTLDLQRIAFARYFSTLQEVPIIGTCRVLCLLEKL